MTFSELIVSDSAFAVGSAATLGANRFEPKPPVSPSGPLLTLGNAWLLHSDGAEDGAEDGAAEEAVAEDMAAPDEALGAITVSCSRARTLGMGVVGMRVALSDDMGCVAGSTVSLLRIG